LTHKKTAHNQQQQPQQQSPQSSKLKDAELNEKISRLIMSNSSIIAGASSTTSTSSQAIPIVNQLIQHHNTIDATTNQMMLGGEVMPSSLSTSCVLVDNLNHATRFDTAIQIPDGSNDLAASATNTSNSNATTSTNTAAAACNNTSSCCFTCSYCGVKFYEQNEQAYQLHLKSHFDSKLSSLYITYN
jgi:DeoR/GlpR family transcriptional regulator of sugar metabolism